MLSKKEFLKKWKGNNYNENFKSSEIKSKAFIEVYKFKYKDYIENPYILKPYLIENNDLIMYIKWKYLESDRIFENVYPDPAFTNHKSNYIRLGYKDFLYFVWKNIEEFNYKYNSEVKKIEILEIHIHIIIHEWNSGHKWKIVDKKDIKKINKKNIIKTLNPLPKPPQDLKDCMMKYNGLDDFIDYNINYNKMISEMKKNNRKK